MQMFAALSHSTLIKNSITKATSISGNIDLDVTVSQRPEMKYMFEKKFKEQLKFKSFEEWVRYRNPVFLSNQLNPNLHVLMTIEF